MAKYDASTKYTPESYGYDLVPYKRTKNGIKEKHIAKFITGVNNVIRSSDCLDSLYNEWKSDWDIFILFIDAKGKRPIERLHSFFKSHTPLYACFGNNYVVVSQIVSKQIFCMSPTGCNVLGILDLYIYEMGGVLVENDIKPMRLFKGISSPNVTWEIKPSDVVNVKARLHGWFSRDTELALMYVLQNNDYKNVIELGSWLGCSTKCILNNMKSATALYCFDKFQNVLSSPFETKYVNGAISKLDQFYLNTPRFETFCKNISECIGDKHCYPIKHDVNDFITILSKLFVTPNIIFIDAVKNTDRLVIMLTKIFKYNKRAIVVGDDYVFDSVRKAVGIFKKTSKITVYEFESCYVMSYIKQPNINKFIKSNYFNSDYMYVKHAIDHGNSNKAIAELKTRNVDINEPLGRYNQNTLYTLAIIGIYQEGFKSLIPLRKYMEANYKCEAVPNVLGLTYLDYAVSANVLN